VVAYIDTGRARLRIAGCSAVVALIGAGAVAFGALGDGIPLLAWLGGLLVLLGVVGALWALAHPSRAGLPALPRTEACREGRHDDCPGPGDPGGRCICGCECHGLFGVQGDPTAGIDESR
jgi:hypothetical protein